MDKLLRFPPFEAEGASYVRPQRSPKEITIIVPQETKNVNNNIILLNMHKRYNREEDSLANR